MAVFTLPSIVLVCIMMYIPFILSGYYSLTEWNGISKSAKFVGLANFKTLFTSGGDFLPALGFTTKYTICFVIFSNVIALALTGWNFWNYSWLGDSKLVFFSVVLVGVWQSLGFYIVLYIAGLQAVPKDVLEAAVVDGANSRQSFFKVTLPLLGPSFTTCIFMSLTNGLKVFDIILALTKGGPGTASNSVTLQIYKEAFTNNNYGLGSAESIIYFLFVLVVTQLVLKGFSRKEVEI